MGYSTVNVHALEPEGRGRAVRFVRRNLGVGAFGINWFELGQNVEGHRHDEADTRQEEVNICIRGSGVYRIDAEEVPVQEGSIFRFDPETTRQPVAGPDGMTLIAVGARRGSYEPRGAF